MKKWQRPATVARELGVDMRVMLNLISDGSFQVSHDVDGKMWCSPSEHSGQKVESAPSVEQDADAILRLAERHADDLRRLHSELKATEIGRALAESEASRQQKDRDEIETKLTSARQQLDDLLIRMEFERKRATLLERATTRPWYQFTEKAADLRQANAMRLALPAE